VPTTAMMLAVKFPMVGGYFAAPAGRSDQLGDRHLSRVLSSLASMAYSTGVQQHRRTAPVVAARQHTSEQGESAPTMIAPVVRIEVVR
jgi:hypothetical protein